ncbi:DUF4190 domain-containing protein [Embleya sp. NPDC005575]|uniref:DUF4190 domain-containing protein n=1 Tax=Embleya sp. NPDC005575 TaxID=3156892 RepID=UPI0033A50979
MTQPPQHEATPPIPPSSLPDAGPGAVKPPYDLLAALAPVAAFFCPVVPVGMVLGIVGLQRIRHSGERGRWTAAVAIVINGAWLIAFFVLLTFGLARDDDPPRPPAEFGASLRKGDCFVTDGAVRPAGFDAVGVVPCTRVHIGEIYAVFTIDSQAPYPGTPGLDPVAGPRCARLLAGFLPSSGTPVNEAGVRYLLPDRARWDSDRREVACYVADTGVRLSRPDELG